ncbi:MAG TPA: hypothetical protein VF161_01815 [Steroidobacteraceae bacterium]
MEDELKKLGLRLRPRVVEPAARPGQIAFDDRGNAVFAWSDARLVQDGEEGDRARQRALDHPGLSLVEDEPFPNAPIRHNARGLRVGYNPYESGLLPRKPVRKKRDLRELSRWMELKRRLEQQQDED